MDLPRPLAPWGPYLSIFPRDLALSLGPVLQRLSSALGPLKVRRASGEGEADGFDGLSRRGPYERLLASEWLLADEEPAEFLRRAVMGEHIFLRINSPEPGGSRVSVAIFDAGPGQLGSPRIAQLAALIVLARRAEAAGVRFAWGILQDPEAPLSFDVTEPAILRLLQARTPHEATDAQVAAWRARVHGWKEMDDLWIVGPPRLSSLPTTRGASVLQVWDILDPEVRRVAVKVRRGPGGPLNEVALELPADAACVRLLRDPFAATAAPPRRLERRLIPASNLVFAANGSKLFARASGGGIVALSIPNSPRGEAGAPRLYDPRPGEPPVAVGLAGKQVVVATSRHGVLTPWSYLKRGAGFPGAAYAGSADEDTTRPWTHFPQFQDAEAGDVSPLLQPFLTAGGTHFAVDAAGGLFRLVEGVSKAAPLLPHPPGPPLPSPSHPPGEGGRESQTALHALGGGAPLPAAGGAMGEGTGVRSSGGDFRDTHCLERLAERTTAVAVTAGQLAYVEPVEPAGNQGPARIVTVAGNGRPVTAVLLEGPAESAFFGFGGKLGHRDYGLIAVEHPDGSWEILGARGRSFLTPFAGTQVQGIVRDAQRGEPGLLLLDEDRRTLVVAGLGWTRRLAPAAAEIVHAAASASRPHVAYVTSSGEVVVLSLDHDAPLVRLIPEGGV
jgi:hypothetical protein